MPYVARDDQGRIIDVQERETEAAYEQVPLDDPLRHAPLRDLVRQAATDSIILLEQAERALRPRFRDASVQVHRQHDALGSLEPVDREKDPGREGERRTHAVGLSGDDSGDGERRAADVQLVAHVEAEAGEQLGSDDRTVVVEFRTDAGGNVEHAEEAELEEQVLAGASCLKLHEDWGTTPAAIDAYVSAGTRCA